MKTIPLGNNIETLIDDDDFDLVSRFTWHCHRSNENCLYAMTDLGRTSSGKKTPLYLHRLLVRTKVGECIDHINRDTLDNRKKNLRVVTHWQNMANRGPSRRNKSGFKGVKPSGKKWTAAIGANGNLTHLGTFDSPKEAAMAYDRAALDAYGEFAYLNFPKEILKTGGINGQLQQCSEVLTNNP